ncbi:uncharacterized protein FOMMEDRAFT_112104 [Fomitiporia mediterranea MF3/22]|uniref:uncharacterized protein n=1 Tax=Fomitiporia mediterranea (strain MF3/22) TaxID=694068 RepID=UPI0004407949|nr:uncharacterized protein FOMMEDRAFT_112104 [Fomitiporia mediterranea MF3/22]EJD00557.1 hypothetical protein FOMMEDRAFT_112104 [Fomitiporia mediterranea MF3/22]
MNDASVKTGAPISSKVRTVLRGGRGGLGTTHGHGHGHGHVKNKTWIAGRASASPSPAPDGRWERGRGGGASRGRGRSARTGVNGHMTLSANVTEDEDDETGVSEAGPSRVPSPNLTSTNGAGKTWEELVKERESERARAIREGKMDDPTKPKRLDEAITIVGTCQDMCPEFERYRRERENNLDKWECIVGPDGRPTKKVDHARAVKIYERGQGDKIIPSDLRPAPVLKRTLDYLFHALIPRGGFADTQAFVRDRSRAVRNDFTIQQDTGPIAMECHERCTRFHILSLHLMYGIRTFDRALEIQQLMNSLLSLKEFYDDQRGNYQSPNELEMRIYHRLGLIRDQHERNDRPPPHIATDPAFQLITRFRSEVQRASVPITKTSQMKVSAEAMQTFMELAGVLRERRNIVMIYLIACFLEHIFGKDTIDDMESIKGELSIQDIIDGNSDAAMSDEAEDGDIEDAYMDDEMIEEDDDGQEEDEMNAFIQDEDGAAESGNEVSIEVHPPEEEAPIPNNTSILQSQSAPAVFPSSSPFGNSTSRSPFGTIPANESVFGKIVSSSSTPSVFGNTGSSSVFGNAMNLFNSRPNVFGGPVFGASTVASSSTPPKSAETAGQSTTSMPPSTSTILQETKPLRSLADSAPLASGGGEDHVDPSETVQTAPPPPPFASSRSAPVLNPAAPSFAPGAIRPSQSSTPFAAAEARANLTPIRTDSLWNRIIDPNRGVFATPVDSPSQPFPSPSPRRPQSGSSLSINTTSALQVPSGSRNTLDSPVAPPALRKAPISLPGTPTASFSASSIPPVEAITPNTPYHFPALRVNISSTTTSTPNLLPPSSSRIVEPSGTSPRPDRQPPTSSPLARNTDVFGEKLIDSLKSVEEKRDLNDQAYAFSRTHGMIPTIYKRWKQKIVDNAKWKEACQRSDSYKQKLHESTTDSSLGSLGSFPSASSFKRQRSASELNTEQQKRPRRYHKRISNPAEQRTDEELAEKLMQNRQKYERRWARGLFTKAIQDDVRSRVREIPASWATWLCMNPDNDKTAIWLEQKFDVPKSGNWVSEAVFAISASETPEKEVFPGLIVFECTPLEGAGDDIERKYRVLDDCSRLRDVVSTLPEDRHYTPSILFINWDSSSGNEVDPEISHMIAKYIEDGILRDSVTVIMSSDDTNETFANCLSRVDVDLRGDLVEKLNLSDLFEWLSPPWSEAASIWVDACSANETFDWRMFTYVVEHFVESLNALLGLVSSLWRNASPRVSPLSLPLFGKERDEQSVPSVIADWLRSPGLEAHHLASHYLSSGFSAGAEARTFFYDLLQLACLHAQRWLGDTPHYQQQVIPKKTLEEASAQFTEALERAEGRLRALVKSLPRASPKRKANGTVNGNSNGNGFLSGNGSVSQTSSPSPQSPSVSTKRARVSQLHSFEPLVEDQDDDQSFVVPTPPTPSVATSVGANSSVSSITAAMLRALSRDVIKKYGGKGKKRESGS